MPKPINIAAGQSTAHSQAAEFAALAGVASQPADVVTLQQSLKASIAKQAELTEQLDALTVSHDGLIAELADANSKAGSLETELTAEKEAHAKTQAALTAATSA